MRQMLLHEIKRDFPKPKERTFGPKYDEVRDGERIRNQMEVILDYMIKRYPRWQTVDEIKAGIKAKEKVDYPQTSISAQLRHLRKPRFGGYEVISKRREESSLFEYLVVPKVGA